MTVLKIIGIVLLVILILLIILLNIPVRVHAAYLGRRFSLDVKYLFLKVYEFAAGGDELAAAHDASDDELFDEELTDDDIGGSASEDDIPDDTQGQEAEVAPAETSSAEAEAPASQDEPATEQAASEAPASDESSDGDEPAASDEPAQQAAVEPDADAKPDKPDKPERKRRIHLADKIACLIDKIQRKTEAGLLAVELLWPPVKRLLKKIYFTGVDVDLVSCNEDAATAAIVYGSMNAGVYNVLGTLCSLTRVDIDRVRIDCLYDTPADRSVYDAQLTLRMRPASLVNAVLAIGVKYLFHMKRYKPILKEFL